MKAIIKKVNEIQGSSVGVVLWVWRVVIDNMQAIIKKVNGAQGSSVGVV